VSLRRVLMVIVVGAALTSADVAAAKPAAPAKCTIKGGPGAEQLHGTSRRDVICSRGGDDVVYAGSGNDTIVGGSGDDELHGELGDDSLAGGGGDDVLDGGSGQNTCAGGDLQGGALLNICVGYVYAERISVRPGRVDTSKNARDVQVEVVLVDTRLEPAGFWFFRATAVLLRDQSVWVGEGQLRMTSGDAHRGVWRGSLDIDKDSPRGKYGIRLDVVDRTPGGSVAGLGEPFALLPAAPDDGRFEGFVQEGPGDTGPPQLLDLQFVPPQLDTSGGPASTNARMRIRDDSGVRGASALVKGPGATKDFSIDAQQRVAGSRRDGIWTGGLELPARARPGKWEVKALTVFDGFYFVRYDTADLLRLGGETGFDQVGPGDAAAPRLTSFGVDPTHFNAADRAMPLQVSAATSDDDSGICAFELGVRHQADPSAGTHITFPTAGERELQIERDTSVGGPGVSTPTGTYDLSVELTDCAGNTRTYGSQDLEAAGWSAHIYKG